MGNGRQTGIYLGVSPGTIFGHLKVIRPLGRAESGYYLWLCLCSCGNQVTVIAPNVIKGNTKSCGCLRDSFHANRTATKVRWTPEYRSWRSMLRRCYHPSASQYGYYGGRGIQVCERWKKDFQAFLSDMGLKPSPTHTIERLDVNEHYRPGNCRWADRFEQARNKRTTRRLTLNGETLTIQQWAERLGVRTGTLSSRHQKGWSDERILTEPVKSNCSLLTAFGRTQRVTEWARERGVGVTTILTRLSRGWTPEDALQAPAFSRRKSSSD